MEHTPAYRAARRHVARKIGFSIHLAVFLAVNLLNLLVVPNRIWAVWPLFGWGIGLLFHGLAVFLHAPGAAWKERMIENELKKIQHKSAA